MMSVMVFAESNPDPYLACRCGVSWHPRYHDCENCEHIADKTCEYGIGQKTAKELQAALAEGEALLNVMRPKRNPIRLP